MDGAASGARPDADGFVRVATAAEVREGQMTAVQVNDTAVILTRLNGTVHAFSARCPHASGDLSQGDLYRGRIDCPDHGYRFDVRSGRTLYPADEVCHLKLFAIREENGRISIRLQAKQRQS